MVLLTSTERVVGKRFENYDMHACDLGLQDTLFYFMNFFIFASANKKKINGIPTENKDNMISSIAKMSEGGRPENK